MRYGARYRYSSNIDDGVMFFPYRTSRRDPVPERGQSSSKVPVRLGTQMVDRAHTHWTNGEGRARHGIFVQENCWLVGGGVFYYFFRLISSAPLVGRILVGQRACRPGERGIAVAHASPMVRSSVSHVQKALVVLV